MNTETIIRRQYKQIKAERMLNISNLDIIPLGTDEVFVKLMDYKNAWLSNYGRVISFSYGKYNLLQGSYDNQGALRYTLKKNVFFDGKWIYRRVVLYAAKAVIEEFIVNPDKLNNIYIWHSGYDKDDYYYRNLYPLNQKQYAIVKSQYKKTGDDSEEFILKVMDNIRYKPDDWSMRALLPVMCGIGYRGSEDVDCKSEAYLKWHDMMNRCYNEKFHERQPQYKNCTVCEKWHNFINFKVWYDNNKYGNVSLDLDKDILFKDNSVYSPETVSLVPHAVNTLFLNAKESRGNLPVGVYYDSSKKKYRAEMSYMGENTKIGRFDTAQEAFEEYKKYKEKIIWDAANLHKGQVPDKVYEAMMNWEIEIDD